MGKQSRRMGQAQGKDAGGKRKADVSSSDIKAYQSETNFSKVELKKVIAAFDKECNEQGVLDREAWKRVLVRLEQAGLKKNLASDPFADDLYNLVDANGTAWWTRASYSAGSR